MMRDTLLILMSRSIDLGRPTPRWVSWASRLWPDLAEQDRRMRRLDTALRDEAALEHAPTCLPFQPARSTHDARRGRLASGIGLAAAAVVALGLFVWRANESVPPAAPPGTIASDAPTLSPQAPDAAVPLAGLLNLVEGGAPASLRAGVQLQNWASFLLLDLPATAVDPLGMIRKGDAPDGHDPAPSDRVL